MPAYELHVEDFWELCLQTYITSKKWFVLNQKFIVTLVVVDIRLVEP